MVHCFQLKSFPFFEKLCKEIFHSCINQLPPRCTPLVYDKPIQNPPEWVKRGTLSLWDNDFKCIRSSVYLREDGYLWESGGVFPQRMDLCDRWVVLPATPSTFLAQEVSLKSTKLMDIPESPKLPSGYQGFAIPDDSPLRPPQKEAVRKANAPLSFIWGPPGTGKTFTIVKAVEAILAADRDNKVLVTATADKAVQALVDGLLDLHLNRKLQQFKDDDPPQDVPHRRADFFSAKARVCVDKRERDHYLAVASSSRNHAQVLCANSLSVVAKALKNQLPFITHLIIDEASMMPMWMVSILVHFLVGEEPIKIVLVGDPNQLPCVIASEEVKEDHMGMNPYQYFGVGDIGLSTPENVVTFLDRTSRMPNQLARAVSSTFYDGALHPLRNPDDFNGLFRDPREQQVGYWNGGPTPWGGLIQQFNPTAPNPPKFPKNTSMDEACEVTKLAWLCQQKNRKCLILTPYNNQVYLINSWLKKNNITCAEATTIHKAQGQEADIVIWSVVANVTRRGASYFNRFDTPVARPLANVALSRAKQQVFIIGADPSQPTVVGRFLDNWEKAGQSVPSAPQPQAPVQQLTVQAEPQKVQPQAQVPQEPLEVVEQVEEQPISYHVQRCHYFSDWFDWNGLDDYILSELRRDSVCTQKKNDRWTEPRLTAWFSEDNVAYEYSRIRHESQGWPDWAEHLAEGIKGQYGDRYHKPNSVLVNVYRNGEDYVSMHKDDEPLFDNNQPIASVSLGTPRAFAIGTSRTRVDHTMDLEDKSLLLMLPGFQDRYWHSVPRQPDVQHARVNLTFRYVKPQKKPLESPENTGSEVPQYVGAYAGIGARKTPQDILDYMGEQARILQSKGLILRTGDAQGADKAFRDAAEHKLVYTPNQHIEQWARDEVSSVCDTEYVQMKDHTRNLLARNMYQLFGSGTSKNAKQPSKFVLYWSLPSPEWGTGFHNDNYHNCSGGTRYAVRAACKAGVPTFNLYNQMKHWETYRDNDFDALTALSIVDERRATDTDSEVSADPAPTDNTPEVINQPEVPTPTGTSGELDPKFKEWLESTGRIDKYLDGPGYRKDHMKRVYKLILEKTNK